MAPGVDERRLLPAVVDGNHSDEVAWARSSTASPSASGPFCSKPVADQDAAFVSDGQRDLFAPPEWWLGRPGWKCHVAATWRVRARCSVIADGSDGSDGVDFLAGGVLEVPVHVVGAGVEGAGVPAAHGDHDVGRSDDLGPYPRRSFRCSRGALQALPSFAQTATDGFACAATAFGELSLPDS